MAILYFFARTINIGHRKMQYKYKSYAHVHNIQYIENHNKYFLEEFCRRVEE